MICFLAFLATSFLAGIAILFALDLPESEPFGRVNFVPTMPLTSIGRRIGPPRPMAAAVSETCLDDF